METTPLLTRPKKKSVWSRLGFLKFRKRELRSRAICVGQLPNEEYPANHICNQKYNVITFLPLVLFEQFRFFLNLYFLVMAISQFIPSIRIGYLYTYWGPLCFVLAVTLFREAVDDYRRYRRDKEVNRQRYERIVLDYTDEDRPFTIEQVSSSKLRVGDIVMLHKGQRVPADMILLRTNETMGTVYIRTDQLDGEIDWKLRIPLPSIQKLPTDAHLLDIKAQVFIEKPDKDIHSFIGTCTRLDEGTLESLEIENTLWSGCVMASGQATGLVIYTGNVTGTCTRLDEGTLESLEIENTLWSGCVMASGQATGLVIYTGTETRSVMNNAAPRSKVGRLDLQVNDLTKVLFVAVLLLSLLLIVLKGFVGPWYGFFFRFVLLFSYIIPISLRVNLDMGKAFYSWAIQRDSKIAGTVVRSTTIPEELGRVQYLLADKTGTLTMNEMHFQKIYLGNMLFDKDSFHEIEALLTQYVTNDSSSLPSTPITPDLGSLLDPGSTGEPTYKEVTPRRVWQTVVALALCHNVTPVYEVRDQPDDGQSDMSGSVMSEGCGGAVPQQQLCDYQASSPDEVALVKWTDTMGVSLYQRDLHSISLKLRAANDYRQFTILQIFPFTSETKMMGIIVQEENEGEITYYVKGADVALAKLLDIPRRLAGECDKMAAGGLRTLLVAQRTLSQDEYTEFESEYKEARLSASRSERLTSALSKLQRGLRLLCLTGVEDRLAEDVPNTLSLLRTAGIKIWMLTGDKLETALCIARSLHLGGRDSWHVAPECSTRTHAHRLLQTIHGRDEMDLIIEGETLEVCLRHYEEEMVRVLRACSGVVIARCSPTQKARVARLLRARGLVVAAAGDGGNDVAMIQEADMGVGIEGAEGRAASLAGDVSVRRLACLARLLLVHGRRATMRSAALTLFIVHRGLIVSTMQAVFSVVFYFSSVSLYPGFLMVGYGTVFTVLPVFSLVLDKDIPSSTVLQYPQLYKQLTKGRQLSYKTFCIWTGISIYQGAVIMYGALLLFEEQLIHIVEISYTALILTELIMVALTAATYHRLMLAAELVSLLLYTATLLVFTTYFDADFIRHWDFWWKVTTITLISCLPLYVVKYMHRKWSDRQYKNLRK